MRRPRKRKRANAYAERAAKKTDTIAVAPEIDEHVRVPVDVRDIERSLARPLLARRSAQDLAEVVEGDLLRDERLVGDRVDGVERSRDDVEQWEERERDRDQPDEVAPPVPAEPGPATAHLCDARPDLGLCLIEGRHLIVSRPCVRQNEMAEIPATMKKMKIETAAASAYWAPAPAWKASLYV